MCTSLMTTETEHLFFFFFLTFTIEVFYISNILMSIMKKGKYQSKNKNKSLGKSISYKWQRIY